MTFKEWKVDDGTGGGGGGGLAMACLYAVPPYNQTTRESERPHCVYSYTYRSTQIHNPQRGFNNK